MKETFGIIGFIVIILVLIGAGPLITIWSLNTLFSLNIAYNFATWFSTIWLGGFFYAAKGGK